MFCADDLEKRSSAVCVFKDRDSFHINSNLLTSGRLDGQGVRTPHLQSFSRVVSLAHTGPALSDSHQHREEGEEAADA